MREEEREKRKNVARTSNDLLIPATRAIELSIRCIGMVNGVLAGFIDLPRSRIKL